MASLPGRRERQVKKISVRVHNVLLDKRHSGEFFSWTNLKELRNYIQKVTGIAPKMQRLFHHHSELLNNQKTLEDLLEEEEENSTTIWLSLRYDDSKGSAPPFVRPFMTSLLAYPDVKAVVQSITKGFLKGFVPKEVKDGLSGSYFLRGSEKEDLCIFKPFDEEPYAPNNPKGFVGKLHSKGIRKGVLSGEGAAREVAAYLIDDKRIHRVPLTFFAEVFHPYFERSQIQGTVQQDGKITSSNGVIKLENTKLKFGSLQLLKKNNGTSDDFSCRLFSLEQMQAIAALDIRILNCDRNTGNILVKRSREDGRVSIYPIDHSLSFPDNLSIVDWEVCWTVWPQVEQPTNPKLKEYISTLNPRQTCKMLKNLIGMRPICLRNYRIAETLLIKGTELGLTLAEIGKILYKKDLDETSVLEGIVKKAEEMTLAFANPAQKVLYLKDTKKEAKKQNPKHKEMEAMSDMKTDASDNSNGGFESSDTRFEVETHTRTDGGFKPLPYFQSGPPNSPDSPTSAVSYRKRAQSCLPENESQILQSTEFDWDQLMQLTPKKSSGSGDDGSDAPKSRLRPSTTVEPKPLQKVPSLEDIHLNKSVSVIQGLRKEHLPPAEQELVRDDKEHAANLLSGSSSLTSDYDNEVFFHYYEAFLKNYLLKITRSKPRERLNSYL